MSKPDHVEKLYRRRRGWPKVVKRAIALVGMDLKKTIWGAVRWDMNTNASAARRGIASSTFALRRWPS